MVDPEQQYYFNIDTREVEKGMVSPSSKRVGPFATAEEAAAAPQLLEQRSRTWAEEDEAEDDWGTQLGTDAAEGEPR